MVNRVTLFISSSKQLGILKDVLELASRVNTSRVKNNTWHGLTKANLGF